MPKVVLRSAEIETLDSTVQVLAYRKGRKYFVATVINGDELVKEAASKEAALLTFGVQVTAVRNLAKPTF